MSRIYLEFKPKFRHQIFEEDVDQLEKTPRGRSTEYESDQKEVKGF